MDQRTGTALLGRIIVDAWTFPRRVRNCWLRRDHRWVVLSVDTARNFDALRVCAVCHRRQLRLRRGLDEWMSWEAFFWR